MILGIGYDLLFNCLFKFSKVTYKTTRFVLCLSCDNYWAPQYESFAPSRNHIRNKRSTSFLNISSCTFGTGYDIEHIIWSSSFNSSSTEYIFQVPRDPSNNSSKFCNNLGNSLRFIYVKFWHRFFITLFKSDFSYLASNIARYRLLEVRTFTDSFISSV